MESNSRKISLYESTILYPIDTGLEMTIWVFPNVLNEDVPRIIVSNILGNVMTEDDVFSISIADSHQVIDGKCKIDLNTKTELHAWINDNMSGLNKLWMGEYSSLQFVSSLK